MELNFQPLSFDTAICWISWICLTFHGLRSEQRFQHSKFHRLSTILMRFHQDSRWKQQKSMGAVKCDFIFLHGITISARGTSTLLQCTSDTLSKLNHKRSRCICFVQKNQKGKYFASLRFYSLLFDNLQLDVATDLTKRQSFGFAGGQRR